MTSAALWAVGATSTGGATVVALKKFVRLQLPARLRRKSQIRRIDHDKHGISIRTSAGSVAS
jgi:hypothetical protein